MAKFKVWCPDDGGEDDAFEMDRPDAEWAARSHAESRDRESGDGYSSEQTIMVRCPDGALMKFVVKAEASIEYRAIDMAT